VTDEHERPDVKCTIERPGQPPEEPVLTPPTAFELDNRLKDIIDQASVLFPEGDFREGGEFRYHGEWELALDSIFFALKALHRDIPADLYEKIVSANERMGLFDASHYDAIKPRTRKTR